jgi:8-oxo-dGTP diphosphatase
MVRRPPSYCPHCGAELCYPEGVIHFECDSCDEHLWLDHATIASVGVVDGDALLLQMRAIPPGKGTWGLPGGHVDVGESPEGAAARELREEVNLRVDPDDLAFSDEVADAQFFTLPEFHDSDAVVVRSSPALRERVHEGYERLVDAFGEG